MNSCRDEPASLVRVFPRFHIFSLLLRAAVALKPRQALPGTRFSPLRSTQTSVLYRTIPRKYCLHFDAANFTNRIEYISDLFIRNRPGRLIVNFGGHLETPTGSQTADNLCEEVTRMSLPVPKKTLLVEDELLLLKFVRTVLETGRLLGARGRLPGRSNRDRTGR